MPGDSFWPASKRNPEGVFLLRADGSATLGMGHLMRMSTLAEGLARSGVPAKLLIREDPAAEQLLRDSALRFECLPADVPLHEDAELTNAAATRLGADVIVTDICHAEALADLPAVAAYHKALRKSGALIVSFGGAEYVDESADIAVSPYVGAERLASAGSPGQLQLCGPKYFVFRPDFVDAGAMPRIIASSADRVLITIGGADPAGLTQIAVAALASLDAPLRVRVVIGSGFTAAYRRRLKEMTSLFDGRLEWRESPDSIAELMCWADLAIIGDGLTKYEAALTGTPSIMLSRTDSPQSMNEQFVRMGTALHLKPDEYDSADGLASAVQALRNDFGRRKEMAQLGKGLFDGKGLQRLMTAIEMRRARTQDQA